jgi:DNA-binding transcriptional LysR family regulator
MSKLADAGKAAMDAGQLEAFVTVVDIGSFTRAAVRLKLSQPTVTARVKSLEARLGTKLLERLHTSIKPTPAGNELLPLAREIVRLSRQAQQIVHDNQLPRGKISIGSTDCLTTFRLLPLIEYVYLRYPAIEITFHSSDAHESIAEVRQGRLDCAIFVDTVQNHGELEHRVLCPEPLCVLAAPDHELTGKPNVTTEDLRDATWVRCENGPGYHAQLEQYLGLDDHPERPRTFGLDSIDAAKRMVANGVGVSLMPSVAARQEVEDGTLRCLDWQPPFETFTQIAWRRDSVDNGVLAILIDDVTRLIEEDLELAG